MSRRVSKHPTELELEILKILWGNGPLAVRDVREQLESQAGRVLAHSTVITMLNILHRKGYVRRKKQGKAFVFFPKVEKESVTGQMMGDLLSRVFDGSASAMMLNLLETSDVDAEEMAQLRKLINRKSKEQSQ